MLELCVTRNAGNLTAMVPCKSVISDMMHSTASKREARLKQHGALHTADNILALNSCPYPCRGHAWQCKPGKPFAYETTIRVNVKSEVKSFTRCRTRHFTVSRWILHLPGKVFILQREIQHSSGGHSPIDLAILRQQEILSS